MYDPSHIAKLDRKLLVEWSEKNEEVAALKTLVVFLDTHPHLIENESAFSIAACLQDNQYRTLLENIESETLEWNNPVDLELEFLDTLKKLQQMQYQKRMAELHSKPLNLLTDEEKRELQRLALR